MKFMTTSQAYLQTLRDVYYGPQHRSSPRGQATRELIDYQFEVRAPRSVPIVTVDLTRNEVIADYTRREFALYESQVYDAEAFGRLSKFWNGLANPDGTVNSAYGFLVFGKESCGNLHMNGCLPTTPWEWAKQCLLDDRDSRQAYIRFSLPSHQWRGNRDQVCTMHVNLRIVDKFLWATAVMRSNDVVRGLVYDMPYFVYLQERMVKELREVAYPELHVGRYRHFAHSMHMYERDEGLVLSMLGERDASDRRGSPGDAEEPRDSEGAAAVGPDDGGDRPPDGDDGGRP